MSGSGKRRSPLVADRRVSPKRTPAKRPARAKSKPRRKPQGFVGWLLAPARWLLRALWALAWRGGVVLGLILGLTVFYYYSTLPPVTELLDARTRGSVTLMDREGDVFAWRGEQFGGQITADTISPLLRNAVVATEDKRFYRHVGISPRGIAGAIRINLREGRGPLDGHGGSTITQQVAKLLCLGVPYDPDGTMTEAEYEQDCRRSSIWRKLKEVPYSLAMETRYSKDEILTIYLNRAYLGAGARGFEAASQRYFGKSAANVDAAEAAMLAGLLTAPSRLAPTASIERAQDRANVVIGLMEDQGYLTATEADRARAAPAQLSAAAEARAGGYFADWVMESGPSFLTRDTTEDVVIRTTFDQDIQRAAEEALQFVFDERVSEGSQAQAAIVVMSADGAVRAMVGGRRVRGISGQFNRAIQANRQTGSAFKPFVYATALELGYSMNDRVVDEPITLDIPGSGPWSPENYDKRFHGTVTLTEALKDSLNIPAVKVSELVGRDKVRTVAEGFGIESDLAAGPALALGASESTLIEMTGAYAGFLNGGSSVTPYGLTELRLLGDQTPLMTQEGGMGERVISETAARQLVYMMSRVVADGTGARAALPNHQAAGKTGTTSAARDAWFLGFTADYVAGVWMGYDDNTPLTGVTGGGLPAEIWHETMVRVHRDLPPRPLPMAEPAPQTVQAPQAVPQRQQPQPQNALDRVIQDALNSLFGAPGR
ncbi:transglycosylase domain-containing protein [Anianabacter salinae]|uniref:transglycosylase domain-containing protein n=1 Tax=Anianabacter salinae TaxID=2851023 RepID=UPI00225DEC1F|nr:PBP1A family penicillin-binding protein [Anianabacter salinae]MBV0913315.1 PBP1A family penicillin-binding protein [Anianabacter salinae]